MMPRAHLPRCFLTEGNVLVEHGFGTTSVVRFDVGNHPPYREISRAMGVNRDTSTSRHRGVGPSRVYR